MIDKIGTNSFQPRTELVTTTEAQPVTSNARKFTVLTVLETVWSETHVKPGPHIMVWIVPIKCVQAIRTIIWNAPKKIRDAIVRIASISIRAIGTDRELFQAIKWKRFHASGTIETIQNGPRKQQFITMHVFQSSFKIASNEESSLRFQQLPFYGRGKRARVSSSKVLYIPNSLLF